MKLGKELYIIKQIDLASNFVPNYWFSIDIHFTTVVMEIKVRVNNFMIIRRRGGSKRRFATG
jgi:hypothetical protein